LATYPANSAESDRKAIEVGVRAAAPKGAPRVCWAKHTEALGDLWVSEALLPEVRQNPQLEVLGDPRPWPFDGEGNLRWPADQTMYQTSEPLVG